MILQGHDVLDREFTQMLHGAGIFAYIYPKNGPFYVGKYSSTMENLG